MASTQSQTEAHPGGVQYVTDESGHRTAVIISLEQWGELWEDFLDVIVAESRTKGPRTPWESVKATLDLDDDLPG